jgi:hypothetical protein
MQEHEIGDRRFALCARPASSPALPAGPDGPRQLLVEKHHVLLYRGGRRVPVLHVPGADGGDFVHVVEGGPDKPPLALPEGWTLSELTLEADRIVRLPTPTTVFFFPNRDSFQGPIAL